MSELSGWRIEAYLDPDRNPHKRRRRLRVNLTSERHERWFTLRRPRFGRDQHGWWLSPFIYIEASDVHDDGYWMADGHMISIPHLWRDRDGVHFRLIYNSGSMT